MRIFHTMQADTSRVVRSWHSEDPASPDSVMQHEYKGSMSINLLGGLGNPRSQPSDSDSFIIANNVSYSVYILIIIIVTAPRYIVLTSYVRHILDGQ